MTTMIAIPCMDMTHTGFTRSILRLRKPDCEVFFAQSSLIYDARNALAARAIQYGYDRVLWLDSDTEFEPDLYERLLAHDLDYVCAAYPTRREPIVPTVYEEVTPGKNAVPFELIPNELFEIDGSGFGAVLMKTELLKEVGELPFSPMLGLGEDLTFCYKLMALGKKMYCDGSVRVGHIGVKVYKL